MVNVEINNAFEHNNEEEEYSNYVEYISYSSEDENNDYIDNDTIILSLYEKQRLYFLMFGMACECISGILILLSILIIIIIWFFWIIKNLKFN